MLAQREFKEPGRHFVVLLIGCVGGDRHRTRLQLPDELQQARTLPFDIALIFLPQTLRQQPSNADANEPIGQQIALQQVIQASGRSGRKQRR